MAGKHDTAAGVSNFELIYGGVALFGLIIIVLLDYFGKKWAQRWNFFDPWDLLNMWKVSSVEHIWGVWANMRSFI